MNRAILILPLVLICLTGCAKKNPLARPTLADDIDALDSAMDLLPPVPEPSRTSGSLWSDAGPGMAMFRDTRAFRVNDLVTIRLAESDTGTNRATTELDRSSSANFGAAVALGLEDPAPTTGQFNLNQVLNSAATSTFEGDGNTARSNSMTATLTSRVMRVLPNGDLVVAGQKTLVVNRERQVLTLVGSIRAVDLTTDNQVASSKVGDLTVRLWGQGEVDATTRQGWFVRAMNALWPF